MRAFTLVELLVALGAVALLAALSLPALKGAFQDGQRTRCVSNMRQVGLALQAAAQDADGYYPALVQNATTWTYWDTAVVWGMVMGRNVSGISANAVHSPFHCPAAPATTGYTYGLNAMFPSGNATYYTPRAVASIRQPSRCVLLGEGSNHAVDAWWFSSSGQKMLFPHQGRENFLFADLHAECLSTNAIPKGGWGVPITTDPFWTGQ